MAAHFLELFLWGHSVFFSRGGGGTWWQPFFVFLLASVPLQGQCPLIVFVFDFSVQHKIQPAGQFLSRLRGAGFRATEEMSGTNGGLGAHGPRVFRGL